MKRNIRFRAWHKKEKKMYFVSHEDICRSPNADLGTEFEWSPWVFELDNDDTENLELMQFTGLKDKNSKEIFEGDIVNHGDNYPSVVIWDDCRYWLEGPGFCTKETGNETIRYHGLPGYTSPIEVIGNRFENPELLK